MSFLGDAYLSSRQSAGINASMSHDIEAIQKAIYKDITSLPSSERNAFIQQVLCRYKRLPPSFKEYAKKLEKELKLRPFDPRAAGLSGAGAAGAAASGASSAASITSTITSIVQALTAVAGAYIAYESHQEAKEAQEKRLKQEEERARIEAAIGKEHLKMKKAEREAYEKSIAEGGGASPQQKKTNITPWLIGGGVAAASVLAIAIAK